MAVMYDPIRGPLYDPIYDPMKGKFEGIVAPSVHFDGTQANISDAAVVGPSLVFARTGLAYAFDASGVLQTVADGVGRFASHWHDGSSWVNEGFQAEGTRIQLSAAPRDLTNAAWTATNITPALNATGLDGVANSATTLTATANNGTITESITSAINDHSTRFWIKRVTGTGTIEITDNNFTNTLDVTSALSSTLWTPHHVVRNQANPVIGIRMGTSGDVIEVDVAQPEVGSIPSSPILVAGATRNRDELQYTDLSVLPAGSDMSFAVKFMIPVLLPSGATDHSVYDISDTALSDSHAVRVDMGSVFLSSIGASSDGGGWAGFDSEAYVEGAAAGVATAFALNDVYINYNGAREDTDTSATPWTDQLSRLELGYRTFTGGDKQPVYGFIKSFKAFDSRISNAQTQTEATP